MNILITGATSGIGFNTGIKLVKLGYNVYFTTKTFKELEVLNEKIYNFPNAYSFKLDVTSKKDRKKLENIDIDVLISNAAIGLGGSILEANMDDVRKCFEVNVFSNFEIIKIVLNNMLKKNKGKIIIMSSMISNISIPFLGIYASTKASISMLTSCLRKEIGFINKNISISFIEPGIYKTGFNKVMLDNKYSNNSKFKELNNSIMVLEDELFNLTSSKNLDSISNTIIKVINKDKPKLVYRAPFIQNVFIKIYIKFFKK
jgi:short-subunit dehydrogenase